MGLIARVLGVAESPRNEIVTSSQLAEAMNGKQTWAGFDVNVDNAVQVASVFARVRIIAEDIGKPPFPAYRMEADGTGALDSPFYRLLHDRPNPFQSPQQFRELLTAHALLRGNGFAFKNAVRGQVRELLPIHPKRVSIEQAGQRLRADFPRETG